MRNGRARGLRLSSPRGRQGDRVGKPDLGSVEPRGAATALAGALQLSEAANKPATSPAAMGGRDDGLAPGGRPRRRAWSCGRPAPPPRDHLHPVLEPRSITDADDGVVRGAHKHALSILRRDGAAAPVSGPRLHRSRDVLAAERGPSGLDHVPLKRADGVSAAEQPFGDASFAHGAASPAKRSVRPWPTRALRGRIAPGQDPGPETRDDGQA
jgi:hypothetical protein